jgi:hypothetical protein
LDGSGGGTGEEAGKEDEEGAECFEKRRGTRGLAVSSKGVLFRK